ncbi:leucine-rich repeat domain-containing protein [Acinetobacter sp.]|uniref:leucine-rich repeat domain-containing protein n=1 Tax=Acinetobacter sp. TaxID=472 RepID=UPI0035B4A368
MSKLEQNLKKIAKDPLAIRSLYFENYDDEIPKQVAQCLNLEKLSIAYSDILKIPQFVSELPKLKSFDFCGCRDLDWVTNLAEYSELKTLGAHCKTIGQVEQIAELTQLEHLTITGNVRQLPQNFSQLKNLQSLELFALPLKTLPNVLSELADLKTLSVNTGDSSLDFDEVVAVLKQCQKLASLKLVTSNLKLNEKISALQQLKKLDLSGNGLQKIPTELYQLHELTELDLGLNQLHNVPKGIGQLSNLKVLKLNSNWQNKIDLINLMNELHQFTKLKTLHLWSCQSLKQLPSNISACTQLQELDVDNNLLIDVPDSLYEMYWLKKLRLTTNPIQDDTKLKLREWAEQNAVRLSVD